MALRLRGATLLLFFLAFPQHSGAQQPSVPACAREVPAALGSACARLQQTPARYASTTARQREGMERLLQNVVPMVANRVDLEPILADLRGVLYRLRVQAVPPLRAAPGETFEVYVNGDALEWKADWPTGPGLFRVSLHPAQPAGAPRIGDEAWILIEEGRYAERAATFTTLETAVNGLAGAAETDRRLLIRAVLEELGPR